MATPLLDWALTRNTDPATSHLASEHAVSRLNGWQAEFVARLERMGVPSTANEIAHGDESIRKRVGELVTMGTIAVVGRRKCEITGMMARVFWIVGVVGTRSESV